MTTYDFDKYQRPIQVYCFTKKEWIDESEVEFVNIEEDMYGRDKLTFKCPLCGEQHTSLRVG